MNSQPTKNTLLQFAQGNRTNQKLQESIFSPTQEKLKNKKFPSLLKNKTSQPHSANLTLTSIEWWTALKNIYRNLTRHRHEQTEAHAGNKGFLQAGVTSNLEVRIFVRAFVAGDSFSLVNPRLTETPEPLYSIA